MQPINHPKSLVEVTVNRIRDAIVSGTLELGSKLSEQRLADSLGVSRSPVHDALAVLQSEGLVNIFPKRGSFVFTPDLKVVEELCEHRGVLESAAIRFGIERDHNKLLVAMEKAVELMHEALNKGNGSAYTDGDLQFHKAIIESCGNRSIIKTYHQSISPVKAMRSHLFTILNARMDESLSEHLEIVEACRSKDVATATAIIDVHAGHLLDAFKSAQQQKSA